MKVKNSKVNIADLTIEMMCALGIIEHSAKKWLGEKYEVTITSAKDGTHKENSKHYSGNAVDIRTKDMKKDVKWVWGTIEKNLNIAYPNCYDVVLESNHIHIEYDPK